jgi:hypothetical protein
MKTDRMGNNLKKKEKKTKKSCDQIIIRLKITLAE